MREVEFSYNLSISKSITLMVPDDVGEDALELWFHEQEIDESEVIDHDSCLDVIDIAVLKSDSEV
jgi:hypothetical protein